MYKIVDGDVTKNGVVVPMDVNNVDCQNFLVWVDKEGFSAIEQEKAVIRERWAVARKKAYPKTADLIGMLYADIKDGTRTFEETIDAIHEKYPESQGKRTQKSGIPASVKRFARQALRDKKRREYEYARTRLEQPRLIEGVSEVLQEVEENGEVRTEVIVAAIPPVPVDSAEGWQDEKERNEAIATVFAADHDTVTWYEEKLEKKKARVAERRAARQEQRQKNLNIIKEARKKRRQLDE